MATAGDSRTGSESAEEPGWRDRIRARPGGRLTLRVVVGVLGGAMIIGGLILVPFPGPGWLIVFAGLAVLATEFTWASRLLDFAKRRVRAATDWLQRQNWFVRVVAGLLTLACAAVIVWLALKLTTGFDLLAQARDLLG
ncbi:TIGR02611 family protein [Microbispora sp. NPDC049125]|uniref:TIGR02611 family protein n=1 Tax=Microbispora sp. NPDC049125 TaxID=3154929 RepID=UPI003467C03D